MIPKKHETNLLTIIRLALSALVIVVAIIAIFFSSGRVFGATNLSVTNPSLLFTPGQSVQLTLQSTDALQWKLLNSLDEELNSGSVGSGSSSIDLGSQLAQGMYKVTFTSSTQTDSVRFIVLSNKPLSNDPFYMVQTHYGQSSKLVYNVDRTISMLKQVGFNGVRDEVTWSRVETSLGQYATPAYARDYMNKVAANNMSMLWIADYGNLLYGSDRYDIGDPATIDGFANYVHAFLGMNPDIKMVEVWNEYNGNALPCKTGTCYEQLLQAVYTKVKPDFPDVQIIGGVTTGGASSNNWQWYRDLFEAGGMNYLDALSIHPYGSSNNTIKSTTDSLNSLVREFNNGQTKPIIVSEFGLSIIGNVTETRQAARIASALIQYRSIPNIQMMSIYDSIDDGEDPADNQDNFGMFKGSSDFLPTRIAVAYEPKPSVQAFYTLRQQLDGLDFISESSVITDTVNRLDFGKAGAVKKSVFVHMEYNSSGSNIATEIFDVAVDPAEVTLVRDMYGNIITRSQGAPTVQLSQYDGPLYLSYLSNETENVDNGGTTAPGAPNTGFAGFMTNPFTLIAALIAIFLLFIGYRTVKQRG